MAVDEDGKEVSISSIIVASTDHNGDALSPEDLAWVDSCLVEEDEISDSSWNSLKNAFLEFLKDSPDSIDCFPVHSDGTCGEHDIDMILSSEEAETSFQGKTNNNKEDTIRIVDVENNGDDLLTNDETLSSQTFSPFLPNYNEDKESENPKPGVDDVLNSEKDPPISDIFKVWDLNLPAEEAEFDKELKKAFTESSVQPIQSLIDGDSRVLKDLKLESLDDLIASVADLSLNQNSK